MLQNRVVVVALVGWLFAGALSAAPQFVPGPSARVRHAMAYDQHRQVVVLFGGFGSTSTGAVALGDLWEWDGAGWTDRTPASLPAAWPTGRGGAALAYDASRQRVVMFGGEPSIGGSVSDETWEWDGASWSLMGSSVSPSARQGASMAYDPLRQRTVLFGGNTGGCAGDMQDTWEWDGSAWINLSGVSAPPRRTWASMAYDDGRGKVVMYGGHDACSGNLGDTHEWDGVSWSLVSAVQQSLGSWFGASLCRDVTGGDLVLFGGATPNGQVASAGLFRLVGSTWSSLATTVSPSSRAGHAAVYDEARGEVVMFGGSSPWNGAVLGDTWTFDGAEWRPKLDYVTSPVNGRRYALSPPLFWQDAESLAVLEGGHLVTVRSAAENAWLYQNLVAGQGIPTAWIGLNDAAVEGQFVWASGEAVTYTSWAPGQPDNFSNEDYVHYYGAVDWNDLCPQGCQQYPGIVELPSAAVASYAPFGAGCPGPTGMVPSLSAPPGEAPVIGASSVLRISNLPQTLTIPVFMLGFSNTQASGPGGVYPLPLDLGILGWSGCTQLVDAYDTVYTITNTGSADHTVTLPPYPFLAGMQFYTQVLVLYAPSGVAVSNAITATAGW